MKSTKIILHVEDDSQIRRATKRLLELSDLTLKLQPAPSVEDAIVELRSQKFDLVICDGSLKIKHDGLRFAIELAKSGQKVVFVSGDPDAVNIAKEHQIPALQKPYEASSFRQLVLEILSS